MHYSWPILSILTFLPLIGVAILLIIRDNNEATAQNSRYVAVWVSAFNFMISLLLLPGFDNSYSGYQFEESHSWLPGISYHMGIDGISMPLILLTTFLTLLAILASWRAISYRVREYMIAFLILECMMIGTFVSLDIFLFYLFFEGGAHPDVYHHWRVGRATANLFFF